jgi:8-oxo-dGTP diphosphatase
MEQGTQYTRYVAGFLFDPTLDSVVLIEKNHPPWQAGRLNGIGGHIETDETSLDAMRREFREEAGLDIKKWELFATLCCKGYEVDFYRAESSDLQQVNNPTDEPVKVYLLEKILHMETKYLVSNTLWLLFMAMPTSRHDWPYLVIEKSNG